ERVPERQHRTVSRGGSLGRRHRREGRHAAVLEQSAQGLISSSSPFVSSLNIYALRTTSSRPLLAAHLSVLAFFTATLVLRIFRCSGWSRHSSARRWLAFSRLTHFCFMCTGQRVRTFAFWSC